MAQNQKGEKEPRKFEIGPCLKSTFISNYISTTKYSALTFFPKTLYMQFRRLANVYFLLVAIVQCIPGTSSLNPVTSILPLVFVILVSMVKEFLEDMRRYSSDREANAKKVIIWKENGWAEEVWKNIKVGDFVRIERNEQIPADIIVLYSPLQDGICNIETTNLDGETNLKTKASIKVKGLDKEPEDLSNFKGTVMCDPPNSDLYDFSGSFTLNNSESIPIDNSNVILRSCSLRNTNFIIGIVCYTGHETKIMKNSGKTRLKRTNLEDLLDYFVLIVFCFQMLLCFFCALMYGINLTRLSEHEYLDISGENAANAALSFVKHVILFNTLIPISLYVTLEVVKLGQILFINNDATMYHDKTDTRANARTSNLNESLGNIEYVFSDKTGTLTQNVMEFFKCTINGRSYGSGISEVHAAELRRMGNENAKPTGRGFEDDEMIELMKNEDIKDKEEKRRQEIITSFFTNLSLCHTCHAEIPKNKNKKESASESSQGDEENQEESTVDYEGTLNYKAASPDEEALVKAASKVGFTYKGKKNGEYVVEMHPYYAREYLTEEEITKQVEEFKSSHSDPNAEVNVKVHFKVLYVLEFNSDRKRNSIILKLPNGKIRMYSKGADAMMMPLLKEGTSEELKEVTLDHMREFAAEGLRTLVLTKRDINSMEEYEKWEEEYKQALMTIGDGKKEAVDNAAAKIEVNLELIGATAIEDKLQEGVPDCIEILRQAGIKVWVLTGDKRETAINIGFACKLLTMDMTIISLSGEDKPVLKKHIAELAHFFGTVPETMMMKYALVIEHSAVSFCLLDDVISSTLAICNKCGVVICCRVSPKQKADVVGAIKDNTTACTLAIGDGANDVPMIQRAHVGVGISGNEGMQAVMSSDYSIAQFRFLQRLLLVHGRLSYKRSAIVVLYSFYKNFCFTLTLFWFGWFSAFSAQTMFNSWYISLFNCIFTVAPIGVYGLGEQEIRPNRYMKSPATYALGRLGRQATPGTFIVWLVEGFWDSFVTFFIGMIMMETCIQYDGIAEDMWFFGTAICAASILTVTLRLICESNFLCWIHWVIVIVSIAAFVLIAIILNVGVEPDMYGNFWRNITSVVVWLYIIICPVICMIIPYVVKFVYRQLKPTVDQVIREIELLIRPYKIARMKEKALERGEEWDESKEDDIEISKRKLPKDTPPPKERIPAERKEIELQEIKSTSSSEPSETTSSSSSTETTTTTTSESPSSSENPEPSVPASTGEGEKTAEPDSNVVAVIEQKKKIPAEGKKKKKNDYNKGFTGFDFNYTVPIEVKPNRKKSSAQKSESST